MKSSMLLAFFHRGRTIWLSAFFAIFALSPTLAVAAGKANNPLATSFLTELKSIEHGTADLTDRLPSDVRADRIDLLSKLMYTQEALDLISEREKLGDDAYFLFDRARALMLGSRCPEMLTMLNEPVSALKKMFQEAASGAMSWKIGRDPILQLPVYCLTALGEYDEALAMIPYVMRGITQFGGGTEEHWYWISWIKALHLLGVKPTKSVENFLFAFEKEKSRNSYDWIVLQVTEGKIDFETARRNLDAFKFSATQMQLELAKLLFFSGVREFATTGHTDKFCQLDALAPYGDPKWMASKRFDRKTAPCAITPNVK